MGWFANDSTQAQAYSEVTGAEGHKAHWSHELIGAAASYEAAKAYEDHVAKNGKPSSHAQAKQMLAGLVGAAVDRLVETKGLDFIDSEKAKNHARKEVEGELQNEY